MTSQAGPDMEFDLSDHLPYLVNHVNAQVDAAAATQLAGFGVSVEVWRVLAVLWTLEDVAHGELAQLTSIEISKLSRLSKAVEQDGLIRRKRTKEDQRTVRVSLTAKGRKLATAIIPAMVGSQQKMMAGLSPSEVKTLIKLLHKAVQSLNSYAAGEPAPDAEAGDEAAVTVEPPEAPEARPRLARTARSTVRAKSSAPPSR